MAEKRRRGTRIYTICLVIYILVLCAAVAFGLGLVWQYAEEYEAARPANTMDAYVANLSENLWDDSIAETIASMPHEAQTDEECAECVKELLAEGISYSRSGGSADGTSITYSLRCANGNEFGKVTLVQDESKRDEVKFDMLPYTVSSEEFDFNALYTTVEVVAPRTYSVYLNDYLLTSEYIVEEDIHYDVLDEYYSMFEDLPTKVRYQFDHAIGTIEPVIKNEQGEEIVIDETQDDSQFITPCTDEQIERLSTFATSFADRYLRFSSGIDEFSYAYDRLSGYIVAGSDLATRLKSYQDGQTYSKTTSYRMDSCVLNSALALGDGYFLCDITADTTIYFDTKGEIQNTNNMRVVAVNKDDDIRAVVLEMY